MIRMMIMLMMVIERIWNLKDKIYTSNNGGNWNNSKTPEQRTGEARSQLTTEKTAHALRYVLM
jgi:hypothetical protein